jgi:hypothetical protein
MANGLSLVIEVTSGAAPTVGPGLQQAFTPAGSNGPTILHYVWVVALPSPDGKDRVLLTTVYDEEFSKYISDLVNANPALFNAAAANIVGLAGLVPVQDNLTAFIQFVKDHDLTQGTTAYLGKFFQAYSWSVNQVIGAMGPGA